MVSGSTGTAFFDDRIPTDVSEHAGTLAFMTIVSCQMLYSLSFRHPRKSIFKAGLFGNKYLVGALLFGLGLQLLVLMVPPLREAFRLRPINGMDWLLVLGLGLIPLLIDETAKGIAIRRNKAMHTDER